MLSIIIPNYNGEKTILKTIESVFGMGEIIVVDDCSTDNSVKIIKKKYPSVKLFKTDSVSWVAYCRNIGIMESTGEYLLFLDNDVYMTPNSVKLLLAKMKKFDIAYPTVDFENGVRMHPREHDKNIGISCVFMISRSSIDRLDELFDETYKFYMEDADFFLRCKLLKLKSTHVKNSLAIHILKNNITNQVQKEFFHVRNMIYFHLKFKPSNIHIIRFLLKNLLVNCALNYSERLRYQDSTQTTIKEKVSLIFNHPRMAESRVDLFNAFFKGIIWNIKNYRVTIKKRNTFQSYLKAKEKKINERQMGME